MYREQIEWNYELAQKSWQEPDEYGRSYELRTKDKRTVKIVRIDKEDRQFPIVGKVRSIWDMRKECTERWTSGGHLLGMMSPCSSDLQLYIVFRYEGVPIPEGVRLSRLKTHPGPPCLGRETMYVAPEDYANKPIVEPKYSIGEWGDEVIEI